MMLRNLKTRLTRYSRRVRELSDVAETPTHKIAAAVFRLALRDPGADLLLRPVQDKRIIKLEGKDMYLTLDKTMLEISNHSFSYHLDIPYERYKKLARMFDIKLDSLIEKEEQNILSNVHSGLSKVLKSFDNGSIKED